MQIRRGRLNEVKFVAPGVIQKIAIVEESKRPTRLKVEGWALSIARNYRANVPRVLDYFVNSAGQEILVIERILGGIPLTKCLPKEQAKYMYSVGEQMARLSQPTSGYGWIKPTTLTGAYETWKSFLLAYANTFGTRLVTAKIIDHKLITKVIALIEKANLPISFPYLLHRDLKHANLIADKKGKVWIVDWENTILGDPLYDLAIMGAREGHTPSWQNLAKGYSLDVNSKSYRLYEILALFGFLDFCRRYDLGYVKLRGELIRFLKAL